MKNLLTALSVLIFGTSTGNLTSFVNTTISKNNLKIWNGEIVNNFDEYPYNASVLNLENNTPFPKDSLYSKFTGSATFIEQNFLLTAGHVVTTRDGSINKQNKIQIAYGGLNLKNEKEFTIFNVKKIYRYSNFYNFKGITVNDLAIIEIEPHPEILVKTINLPNENNLPKLIENNKIVRNIGWGIYNISNTTSEKLRYYDAFIQNENEANNYLHTKEKEVWDLYKNDSMIATKSNNSKSSMGHDSGGPLLSFDNTNNQYVQIGITSWGLNYALDNKNDGFNFYTRLNINFLNWINQIINNKGQSIVEKYYEFLAHDKLKVGISQYDWQQILNAGKDQEKIFNIIFNFPQLDKSGWFGYISADDLNILSKTIIEHFDEVKNKFENSNTGWKLVTDTIGDWEGFEQE